MKDKISSQEVLRALQSGSITTAQAQAMFNGVIPIGDYKGVASILDLDLLVNQPLILAEKQWTLDRVEERNGQCHLTIPALSPVGYSTTAVITVPDGEVWYLCEHEITIPTAALTGGCICVNFRVSSFPKVNSADKLYYSAADPQVYLTMGNAKTTPDPATATALCADDTDIAAGACHDHKLIPIHVKDDLTVLYADVKRDFREGDELNTELRLVGGDTLTLTASVIEALTGAGITVPVYLRVWGRVGKLLVA